MQIAQNGKERQFAYQTEYRRYNKALHEEFYLEAVVIAYAIIEDRLTAFLHHAGIVTRGKETLQITKAVKPYIKILTKEDGITIRNISAKIKLTKNLLAMTEDEANAIDSSVNEYWQGLKRKGTVAKPGYMHDLFLQLNKVDGKLVLSTLENITPWTKERDQLIHALLNKTVSSAGEAMKECAEEGLPITRDIDNHLVKPFKRRNTLRKKYKIQ